MSPALTRRSFLGLALAGACHRYLPAADQGRAYRPSFLHPNDSWVVLRSDDPDFSFEVMDLTTGKRVRSLALAHEDTYYGEPELYFDPAGNHLVAWNRGYDGASLSVLDVRTGHAVPGFTELQFGTDGPPRPTLPAPGGIARFPDFDVSLHTARKIPRKAGIRYDGAPGRDDPAPCDAPQASLRGTLWSPGRPGKAAYHKVSARKAAIPSLTCTGVPSFWIPSESGGGPVRVAARRTRDTILIWSGYSTVREVEADTGNVLGCISATMPQTGLLAFGRTHARLFAARPLDMAVLWNRLGRPTDVEVGGEPAKRPAIRELGDVHSTNGDLPEDRFQSGTRALAYGRGVFVHGAEDGRIRLARLQEANGGPFQVLGHHDSPIRALALAKDRPLLLSGARDGSLKVWDPEACTLLRTLPAHPARVNSVSVSLNGLAASAGPEGIRLWDLQEGHLLRHIETGGAWVSDVVLDPAGTWVAGALLDGSVRLWERSGQQRWRMDFGHGWCAGLAVDPLRGTLAAGFESAALALLNPADGKILRTTQVTVTTPWQGGEGPVHAVAWSPDGKVIAAATGDAVQVLSRNLAPEPGPSGCLALNWGDFYT